MNLENSDWTEAESAALGALREEKIPGPGLEKNVLKELSRRGLLAPAAAPRIRLRIAAAAAAAAVFALGVLVGSQRSGRNTAGPPAAPAAARYVLFLEGAQPATAAEEAARVAEYRSWARREAAAGKLLAGEKLEPSAHEAGAAGPEPPASAAVRGFFIIAAASDEEALATARRCPHAAHGGRVIVRKIAVL